MYLVESVQDVVGLEVENPHNLAIVTQTTLSVEDARSITESLKRRFPDIVGPKKDDICYATQNRQDAVKSMAKRCDVVIVVGSPNSSNSNRLREVAANLDVTAGASAPEVLVEAVVQKLRFLGAESVVEPNGISKRLLSRFRRHWRIPEVFRGWAIHNRPGKLPGRFFSTRESAVRVRAAWWWDRK